MSAPIAADDLPDSLSRWLHFLYGDDTCRCDWLWRRNIAEWQRYVVARDCPHHSYEYGEVQIPGSGGAP